MVAGSGMGTVMGELRAYIAKIIGPNGGGLFTGFEPSCNHVPSVASLNPISTMLDAPNSKPMAAWPVDVDPVQVKLYVGITPCWSYNTGASSGPV